MDDTLFNFVGGAAFAIFAAVLVYSSFKTFGHHRK
jgi:hypothetical protein